MKICHCVLEGSLCKRCSVIQYDKEVIPMPCGGGGKKKGSKKGGKGK